MSLLPLAASTLARRQHGLITSDQLGDLGVSPYRRRRLLEAGTLDVVHDGVYRFVAVAGSFAQHCQAACLARPDVAISGPSAGRLLKLRRMPIGPVHVIVLTRSVQLEGVIVHRTNQLGADDVVVRDDGIRLLATPRLVFDLARFLDDDDLESVLEQVLDRRLTSVPALFAEARRLRRVGRNGSARFGRVLGRRPAWAKPQDSDLEVRLLRALRAEGVALIPQFELELTDGSIVHLDGGDPARRFGVEVDHHTWHGGRVATEYDKWRTRQLMRIGWQVPRISDAEIDRDLARVVSELVELHRARDVA